MCMFLFLYLQLLSENLARKIPKQVSNFKTSWKFCLNNLKVGYFSYLVIWVAAFNLNLHRDGR